MSNILSDIASVGEIVVNFAGELGSVIGKVGVGASEEFWNIVTGQGAGSHGYVGHVLTGAIENFDKDLGRLIVQPLIEGTMGVNYSKLQQDSSGAINTLEGAVGFSLLLDATTEALDAVLKPVFGDRAPEFILDTIRKIPQAVGMEYFLGITLANTFEKAVGTPLEEAINVQVLPSRMDIDVLRQALRQHKISIADADVYREKLGYRPDDWQIILDLGSAQLTIGDLQNLYEHGDITELQFRTYLQQQGYTDSDISYLEVLYLRQAETTGGQVYRQVARTAYMEDAISSKQFTAILETANVPDASISMELAALDMQKSIGFTKLSLADIKVAYNNGDLTVDEVKAQITEHGYSADDMALILTEWKVGPYQIKVTTSVKVIMRYFRSGVITRDETTTALTRIGMAPETISAMLDSPQSVGSAYLHELSPAVVIAAYKDGVLSIDDAKQKLLSLGVSPTDVTVELQIAEYTIKNKRTTRSGNKILTLGDIKDGYKYGTADVSWCIRELVTLGYSQDEANFIMATYVAQITGNPPAGWVILN